MKRLAFSLFALSSLLLTNAVQAQDSTKVILERLAKISEWLDVKDVPPNVSLHAEISIIRQQTQGLANAIAKLSIPVRTVYLTTPPGKDVLLTCSFWAERNNNNAFRDCTKQANPQLSDAQRLEALMNAFCSYTIRFPKGGAVAYTTKALNNFSATDYLVTAAVCSD